MLITVSVLRGLSERTPALGIIHRTVLAAPDLVADTAGTARRGITRLTGSSDGMRADTAIAVLRLNPDTDTGHGRPPAQPNESHTSRKLTIRGRFPLHYARLM
ncbi:hypothetical protein PV371_38875 [Streptomyces sp. TX20-6-3]|uniref:hypothetical protein n=1 Tax=Streptomyces sp. TX20-6-3 TaxID=3028705 RepID=UPI0029BBDA88|nr:hypothetical protein [Streptomyces sp. TX20-6-3]MDX2565469.1 hypothetical protein [Streptomyces sp. TX20-6-3]